MKRYFARRVGGVEGLEVDDLAAVGVGDVDGAAGECLGGNSLFFAF